MLSKRLLVILIVWEASLFSCLAKATRDDGPKISEHDGALLDNSSQTAPIRMPLSVNAQTDLDISSSRPNDVRVARTTAIKSSETSHEDTSSAEESSSSFCQGMYMTMFMDGFHWTLLLQKPPSMQCLNFFVRSWRLENASKFKGAMLFSFLLALLLERLSSVRNTVAHIAGGRIGQHALLTAIYGLQSLLGYILMMITMSFSVELILSVVGGLMVGNLLFTSYESEDELRDSRGCRRIENSPTDNEQESAESSQTLLRRRRAH